jgi:hypothetical protein
MSVNSLQPYHPEISGEGKCAVKCAVRRKCHAYVNLSALQCSCKTMLFGAFGWQWLFIPGWNLPEVFVSYWRLIPS